MGRKWIWKSLIWLVALALAAAAAYVGYVYFSFRRVEDDRPLAVENNQRSAILPVGRSLSAMTFNVGFGAYRDDFSFFMDGGRSARAYNAQSVESATQGMIESIRSVDPLLLLLQEVDIDSDRSWHVDQARLFADEFSDAGSVFALNYDSAYLLYPFHEPIGKSRSGIMTFSRYGIDEALRKSLPIETGFGKLIDLDRCFSICRLPVDNGRFLTLINLHASAYTNDEGVRDGQMRVLSEAMSSAREQGDYVICGGDFNHDLLHGDSPTLFGFERMDAAWLQPLDEELLPEGFIVCAPTNAPTVRDSGTPYVKGETFAAIIDGFVVSQDVEVTLVETVDADFALSDHNPVTIEFVLKP